MRLCFYLLETAIDRECYRVPAQEQGPQLQSFHNLKIKPKHNARQELDQGMVP